jgi:pSer/pThr/pTyr-binding forkhead associated (FHA) protein
MEDIDSYVTIAKSSGQAGFVKQFDHLFLLRRPVEKRPLAMDKLLASRPSHRTNAGKVDPAEVDMLAEIDRPPAWRVAKVKKRDNSGAVDKLTIGRVPSCDVYIALPSVSKQHASFLLEGGKVTRIVDDGSTNGTWLNRVQLAPHKPMLVRPGASLRIGGVEVQLLDAEALYTQLIEISST